MSILQKTLTRITCAFLVIVLCSACNTTFGRSNDVASHTEIEQVTISKAELEELRTAAGQWQQTKADIDRLLVLEQDLRTLVTKLKRLTPYIKQVKSQQLAKHSLVKKHEAPLEIIAPPKKITPSPKQNMPVRNSAERVYALQLASLAHEAHVAKTFKQLKRKAPPLFRGQLVTNVESAKVKEKTYYRLKIGSYKYYKNAEADCEVFKMYKLDCMVSNYTDQPMVL